MLEFIKNNFWKLVIVLAIADVLTLGGFYWSAVRIPDELKLKADKSRILSAREIDWKVYDNFGHVIADKGRGIKYFYVSDVEVPPEPGEDFSKRTENIKFFKNKTTAQGEEYTAKIYQGQPFYKEGQKWYQTETGITTPEAWQEQTKVSWLANFFGRPALATDLSPAPYSETGDGYIEGHSTSFTGCHDATTGTVNDTAAHVSIYLYRENSASWWIRRIALPFNTSALPDDATVSAATLYIYPVSNFYASVSGAYTYIGLVHSFTAATTTLDVSDYIDIGSNNDTAGTANNTGIQVTGTKTIAELTTSDYRTFSFDSTGLAWINLTGYTKLGLREGHDLVKDSTGFSVDGYFNGGNFWGSDQTDTIQDPYLLITYTVPSLYPFIGYIDELRISSGTARWTADFSASLPTTEY